MRGIRETAMGTPDEPVTPKYYPPAYPAAYRPGKYDTSLFDDYEAPIKAAKPKKGTIEIKIIIPTEDLGAVADDSSFAYNWEIAQNKAEEQGYDKIKELLGDSFESKYTIKFNVYDDETEYEVTCTLIPN